MDAGRYESSEVRRRLTRHMERRGSQAGFRTWGVWLFGCPFVVAGTWMILIGTRVVIVDPRRVHAPYWVLAVAGAVFALAGLMVWGMAAKQVAANRRQREAARRYRDEPALADYNWDPRGFPSRRWKRAVGSLAIAGFLTLFLSMFNWWAFFTRSPFMVKAIVTVFDSFLLLVGWNAVVAVGRAFKFGASHIEFPHFPYRLNEPIVIRWQAPTGISHVRKGTFTLRCVEERFERSGSDRNQSSTLIHEEVWNGTWHLDEERPWELGKWMEWRFELPADAQSTKLSAEKPVFWEFEVKLELPGLDFEEVYLVPIYGA